VVWIVSGSGKGQVVDCCKAVMKFRVPKIRGLSRLAEISSLRRTLLHGVSKSEAQTNRVVRLKNDNYQ
jgi:hypothetical protein